MLVTRRLYDRFEVGCSVLVDLPRYKNKTFLLCNLSARGASIYGYDPLHLNEDVKISFSTNAVIDRAFSKYAKVVWVNRLDIDRWEAGLDFGLDNLLDLESACRKISSPD